MRPREILRLWAFQRELTADDVGVIHYTEAVRLDLLKLQPGSDPKAYKTTLTLEFRTHGRKWRLAEYSSLIRTIARARETYGCDAVNVLAVRD